MRQDTPWGQRLFSRVSHDKRDDRATVVDVYPDWSISATVDVVRGRFVVSDIRLFATPAQWRSVRSGHRGDLPPDSAAEPDAVPDGGVTADLWRSLPIGTFISGLLTEVQESASRLEGTSVFSEAWQAAARRYATTSSKPREDVAFLAVRASEYLQRVQDRDSKPARTLALRHGVALSTAQGWIKQARKQGLLTSAGPGRTGGQLTPKAISLLNEGETTNG